MICGHFLTCFCFIFAVSFLISSSFYLFPSNSFPFIPCLLFVSYFALFFFILSFNFICFTIRMFRFRIGRHLLKFSLQDRHQPMVYCIRPFPPYNIRPNPCIFLSFFLHYQFEHFPGTHRYVLMNIVMNFNEYYEIATSFVPTFSYYCKHFAIPKMCTFNWCALSLILRHSRTGTVWFYTSTSNKRAARPKLYTKSLTGDFKLMYSRLTLVRISINL